MSLLSSVSVKDFAYDTNHPLHYGITDEYLDPVDETVRAVALYPFEPENENELELKQDQIIFINYEYGEGWLVAQEPETGKTGLVPSEYVRILDDEELESQEAKPFLPEILQELDEMKITDKHSESGSETINDPQTST